MNPCSESAYSHRSYYVNFAEHLQNHWNVNVLFADGPNRWSQEDWRRLLQMVRAFGFNCFEYWLAPTLNDRPALEGGGIYDALASTMRMVNETASTTSSSVAASKRALPASLKCDRIGDTPT